MFIKYLAVFNYFLGVCLINFVTCKLQTILYNDNIIQGSTVKCVLTISEKHFPTGDIITLTSVNREEQDIFRILSRTYKWPLFVQSVTREKPQLYDSRTKTDNYIIDLKSEEDLRETLVFLERSFSWNPFAKFIITAHYPLVSVANLTKIISTFRIMNVVVMFPTKPAVSVDLLDIHIWYPYANGNCANRFNETVLINRCHDGILVDNETNLFPDKIPLDLNGCYVNARPVAVPPYIILPKILDRTKSNLNLTEGLEVQLLNTLSKAANFKVNYSISTREADWGLISENNSVLVASGLMKLLIDGEVDIGFGCIGPTSIRYKYLDYTVPHMHDHLVWIVPHALPEPKWKCLFIIFHWTTWALTLLTLILAAFCLWALAYNRPAESSSYKLVQSCMSNSLAVLLGISVAVQPRTGHNRFFFIIWIIFSLHLTICYQTYLISVLTLPSYDKQISTLDELFDSKIPYGCVITARRYFENQPDWRSRKVMQEWVECQDGFACVQSVAYDRNYALAYSRLFLKYLQGNFIDAAGKPTTYIFKDSIVTFPVIMQLSRGFPFAQRIDKLIYRVKEAGLIGFWFKQLLWKQKINVNNISGTLQKLSMYNVQGAFIILAFGLSFASVVYVIELVMQICKRKDTVKTNHL